MTIVNRMVRYIKELDDMRDGKVELPTFERFTDKKGRKRAKTSSVDGWKRLCEYENTGLTPSVVEKLKSLWFDQD